MVQVLNFGRNSLQLYYGCLAIDARLTISLANTRDGRRLQSPMRTPLNAMLANAGANVAAVTTFYNSGTNEWQLFCRIPVCSRSVRPGRQSENYRCEKS